MSISFGNLKGRDRNLAIFAVCMLGLAAVLRFTVLDDSPASSAPVTASADSISMAQQRATRLRQIIATTPARDAILKQSLADLSDREKGIIQAETAAQAQAALLEIARRVGQIEQLDVRGGDLAAPKAYGDYGLVFAAVTFDCHIEQLVNFLADLQKQPELIAPLEERIASGQVKQKIINVRMVLAGAVNRKLVPEKKGLGAL